MISDMCLRFGPVVVLRERSHLGDEDDDNDVDDDRLSDEFVGWLID